MQAPANRLPQGVYLHQHTRATAIGSVVYRAMLIHGVIARVAVTYGHNPVCYCPPGYPVVGHCAEHLGKQAHQCNLHLVLSPHGPLFFKEPVNLYQRLLQVYPCHHVSDQIGNQAFRIINTVRTGFYHQNIIGAGFYQVVDCTQ